MTTEEVLKLILQSNVVAAVVVGGFSLLALWLGLGRFRSERWWEKKAQSYSTILEGLHAIELYSKRRLDVLESGGTLNATYEKNIQQDAMSGRAEIRKAASQGHFIISIQASRHLQWALAQFDELDPREMPDDDLYRAEITIANEAVSLIREEAKKDLRT